MKNQTFSHYKGSELSSWYRFRKSVVVKSIHKFYYTYFGAVLMLFELPFERIKKILVNITNPFGKSIFLLFLASIALDIWDDSI